MAKRLPLSLAECSGGSEVVSHAARVSANESRSVFVCARVRISAQIPLAIDAGAGACAHVLGDRDFVNCGISSAAVQSLVVSVRAANRACAGAEFLCVRPLVAMFKERTSVRVFRRRRSTTMGFMTSTAVSMSEAARDRALRSAWQAARRGIPAPSPSFA